MAASSSLSTSAKLTHNSDCGACKSSSYSLSEDFYYLQKLYATYPKCPKVSLAYAKSCLKQIPNYTNSNDQCTTEEFALDRLHDAATQGDPETAKEAFAYLNNPTKTVHARGHQYLGMCYGAGKGTQINFERALHHFKEAEKLDKECESTSTHAWNIGYCYAHAEEKNIDEASYWFLKASSRKNNFAKQARRELNTWAVQSSASPVVLAHWGKCLEQGCQDYPPDLKQAEEFYQKANPAICSEAAYYVALLLEGKNFTDEAIKYYLVAANKDNPFQIQAKEKLFKLDPTKILPYEYYFEQPAYCFSEASPVPVSKLDDEAKTESKAEYPSLPSPKPYTLALTSPGHFPARLSYLMELDNDDKKQHLHPTHPLLLCFGGTHLTTAKNRIQEIKSAWHELYGVAQIQNIPKALKSLQKIIAENKTNPLYCAMAYLSYISGLQYKVIPKEELKNLIQQHIYLLQILSNPAHPIPFFVRLEALALIYNLIEKMPGHHQELATLFNLFIASECSRNHFQFDLINSVVERMKLIYPVSQTDNKTVWIKWVEQLGYICLNKDKFSEVSRQYCLKELQVLKNDFKNQHAPASVLAAINKKLFAIAMQYPQDEMHLTNAVACFEELKSNELPHQEVYLQRAKFYIQQAKNALPVDQKNALMNQAVADLQKQIALSPPPFDAYCLLINTYAELGNVSFALMTLAKAFTSSFERNDMAAIHQLLVTVKHLTATYYFDTEQQLFLKHCYGELDRHLSDPHHLTNCQSKAREMLSKIHALLEEDTAKTEMKSPVVYTRLCDQNKRVENMIQYAKKNKMFIITDALLGIIRDGTKTLPLFQVAQYYREKAKTFKDIQYGLYFNKLLMIFLTRRSGEWVLPSKSLIIQEITACSQYLMKLTESEKPELAELAEFYLSCSITKSPSLEAVNQMLLQAAARYPHREMKAEKNSESTENTILNYVTAAMKEGLKLPLKQIEALQKFSSSAISSSSHITSVSSSHSEPLTYSHIGPSAPPLPSTEEAKDILAFDNGSSVSSLSDAEPKTALIYSHAGPLNSQLGSLPPAEAPPSYEASESSQSSILRTVYRANHTTLFAVNTSSTAAVTPSLEIAKNNFGQIAAERTTESTSPQTLGSTTQTTKIQTTSSNTPSTSNYPQISATLFSIDLLPPVPTHPLRETAVKSNTSPEKPMMTLSN